MRMTEGNSPVDLEMTMDDVQNLVKKKDNIEEQIQAYYDVLEDQGVGIEGPLVDAEGFPRADINIYQIRTARHSISCLQNDHKAIMVEIEEALHKLHAREKAKREQDEAEAGVEAMEQQVTLPPPFARVDAVTQGSPACGAGLKIGDGVIEFGSVNTGNFQNLQNIAAVVQHSEGKPLRVLVVRDGERVQMSLTPQRWSGRGLLGCNIVPIRR
ncbi:26S proteasome non-ATPase regulatory subunit 9 [Solea senegalensis]|uniref:26S proteasome non-ATPase regulatory subunit 9 n=1 Tax=Solea senegalensis TaxID=28829 RepID=A0AAV6QGF8_SOLSE|nr:26S proteasome non-ATPase regulatory subunit 9 [Solea senegalensis]KAG7489595.1 26S proteasome non-ATPase regulatory subunit 9 [Solea senegalensis]